MLHANRKSFSSAVAGALGAVVSLCLLAGNAHAGGFDVAPARLSLSAKQPTALVKISNPGPEETIVRFDVADWSQQNGRDQLKPSRALIVSPAQVVLPPGATETVRVGLRLSAPRWKEEHHRLMVREVPRPPDVGTVNPEQSGTRMARTMSLPVFVLPPGKVQPRLTWALEQTHNGGMELQVSNHGGAHVQLRNARLRAPDGRTIDSADMTAYLLPGQQRAWSLPGQADAGSRWQLIAETDAGPVEAELELQAN